MTVSSYLPLNRLLIVWTESYTLPRPSLPPVPTPPLYPSPPPQYRIHSLGFPSLILRQLDLNRLERETFRLQWPS